MERKWQQKIVWTDKLEKELLMCVKRGYKVMSIENRIKIGKDQIGIKLKELGYKGVVDARRKLNTKRMT